MPRFTLEQVRNIAPDPASFKSGQGLASERQWVNLGENEAALWGECKGSAKEPYKVRVDLSNNGSACTCPSRKFPCKHALGLMLLAASSEKLAQSNPPAWVCDWLEKRSARSEASAKRPEQIPHDQTRTREAARRAAKREKLVDAGIETLEQWLRDFARLGLAHAQTAPSSFWEAQAARMVDCQVPGAARMIREMAALPGAQPEWEQRLLLRLGRLYLLTQAYRKLDSLPEASQQDVRSLLGWNVNQEELLAVGTGILDDWLVLASRTDEDEKTGLRTQINWLYGKSSRRLANILNFAFKAQPMDASLAPGLVIKGELIYFPGAYPLRAIFKDKVVSTQSFVPSGFPNLTDFLNNYACALGQNPWIDSFPVILENITPIHSGHGWLLQDSQNKVLPLSRKFSSPWELLALSGGSPLMVFCLWDGFSLIPQSAWAGERFISL